MRTMTWTPTLTFDEPSMAGALEAEKTALLPFLGDTAVIPTEIKTAKKTKESKELTWASSGQNQQAWC